jgi:hypothetical protein
MVAPPFSGVEVKASFFPLAFLYRLAPVVVVINGTSMGAQWGTQFYPLEPGRYTIGCFTKYLFTQRCGWNTIDVDIYPGQVVRVTWTAPHITFMKGPIRAELIASNPPLQSPATAPVMPPMPTIAQPSSRLCQRCYATIAPGADACAACGERVA